MCSPARRGRRVIRMRHQRRDLIRAPHARWHRGQDFLELVAVSGGEDAERAPFAWLKRWSPEPQQVVLRREVSRAASLPGANVVDGFCRRSIRSVRGHGDEILHGRPPDTQWSASKLVLATEAAA